MPCGLPSDQLGSSRSSIPRSWAPYRYYSWHCLLQQIYRQRTGPRLEYLPPNRDTGSSKRDCGVLLEPGPVGEAREQQLLPPYAVVLPEPKD